eukprot:scaffold96615_cov75-Phaeocystis_antarctica.AAC.1
MTESTFESLEVEIQNPRSGFALTVWGASRTIQDPRSGVRKRPEGRGVHGNDFLRFRWSESRLWDKKYPPVAPRTGFLPFFRFRHIDSVVRLVAFLPPPKAGRMVRFAQTDVDV